jgi:hypothetical protein
MVSVAIREGIKASTLSHPAQALGQDRTAKALAISVPNARLPDRDGSHPRHQLSLGQVAVTHDGGSALGGLPVAVGVEVVFNFLFNGGLEHFAGAFADELHPSRTCVALDNEK